MCCDCYCWCCCCCVSMFVKQFRNVMIGRVATKNEVRRKKNEQYRASQISERNRSEQVRKNVNLAQNRACNISWFGLISSWMVKKERIVYCSVEEISANELVNVQSHSRDWIVGYMRVIQAFYSIPNVGIFFLLSFGTYFSIIISYFHSKRISGCLVICCGNNFWFSPGDFNAEKKYHTENYSDSDKNDDNKVTFITKMKINPNANQENRSYSSTQTHTQTHREKCEAIIGTKCDWW